MRSTHTCSRRLSRLICCTLVKENKRDNKRKRYMLPQYNYRANAPKLRIIMHTLDHIEGTTDALAAQ